MLWGLVLRREMEIQNENTNASAKESDVDLWHCSSLHTEHKRDACTACVNKYYVKSEPVWGVAR